MKNKGLTLILCTLAAGIVASGDADATVNMNQSGFHCIVPNADASKVNTGNYMFANGSSSVINSVSCPIDWWTTGTTNVQLQGHTVSSAEEDVYYVDGTTTDAVVCFVTGVDSAQTIISGSVRGSCSTAGGCAAPVDSYVDRSGGAYIALTPPAAQFEWNYFVACYLPATQSTFQSGIQAYTTAYDETP